MSIVRAILWSMGVAILAAVLGLGGSSGCGNAAGGAEAGNPSLVVGSVPAAGGGCEADRILATDSRGDSVAATVADDCSFELSLPSGEAYALDLVSADEETLASFRFDNTPGRFVSPVMNLAFSEDTVFLDEIAVEDGVATASREPSAQIDQDGDGLPDFSDRDDDGDGVDDLDERDCDLDGAIDDFDADSGCASQESPVLEVSPRQGEGTEGRGIGVKTTEDVKIRLSCAVSAATLAASDLRISPEDDPTDTLDCALDFTGSGKQARCAHSGMSSGTVYTARLDGARCEDGTAIPAVVWSWRTR